MESVLGCDGPIIHCRYHLTKRFYNNISCTVNTVTCCLTVRIDLDITLFIQHIQIR